MYNHNYEAQLRKFEKRDNHVNTGNSTVSFWQSCAETLPIIYFEKRETTLQLIKVCMRILFSEIFN